MANWYVSSVAYAAIAAFQISHAYSVGDIVRPISAAEGRKQAYRCTTGGTSGGSEATWTNTFGSTTTQGTAVFTAVGGDTYGWTAALGDIKTAVNTSTNSYGSIGDNFFLSSDHAETNSATLNVGISLLGSWSTATTHYLSVDRAGSVPPVAADITAGATITVSAIIVLEAPAPMRYDGITFTQSSNNHIYFNSGFYNRSYLKNCSLKFTNATALFVTANNPASVVLDNTSLNFAHAGSGIKNVGYQLDFTWINTATPLPGTAPTTLFQAPTSAPQNAVCRGVDFSGFTGTYVQNTTAAAIKLLLESCKISASATLLSGTSVSVVPSIELVNCWDGSNVLNGRVTTAGTVSTERTIVLSGGAADDVGALSLKMASNSSKIDKYVGPLDCFYFDVDNAAVGSSVTATVEINASATLKNDEVWMQLEYMGTSGNPMASFADSLPATVLTASANLTTSSATWSSDPATPAHQQLQVTFTPQRAGRVRAQVFLAKASTTIYVNPQIAIA